MKKYLLIILLTGVFTLGYSQQNSFEAGIKENAVKLEKATSVEEYSDIFARFTTLIKMHDANKWKAYYYAGLSQFKKAELLFQSGEVYRAKEANAIAYKYTRVSADKQQTNTEIKTLLNKIESLKIKMQ